MPKLVNIRTKAEYPLANDVTVVGRLPTSDIRVLEKQVSRRHCRIVRSREGWVLSDSGSMLGTSLNGELLMRPHCLRPGDEIKVGTEVFVFDKHAAKPRADVNLRPLSAASPGELVPHDAAEGRPRLLPALIGGSLAVAAVGTLVAVLLLTRQTAPRTVRQAADLLRERQARKLWDLVSDERKQALTFEEFQDQVNAVPDEALAALRTLRVGKATRSDRGVVVPVSVRVGDKTLVDEVVLFREDGQWKIHSIPSAWLAERGQ